MPGVHWPITIEIDGLNSTDISRYIEQKLGGVRRHKANIAGLKPLKAEIAFRAGQIFQWAVLMTPQVLDALEDGQSITAIQNNIKDTPRELHDLYGQILETFLRKASEKDRFELRRLVEWTCLAKKPLMVEEVQWALAIDPNRHYRNESEMEQSPGCHAIEGLRKRIGRLSCGLIGFQEARQGGPLVQFIHQSVRDYFIDGGGITTLRHPERNPLGLAHCDLARICAQSILAVPTSVPTFRILSRNEIVFYSAENVLKHMKDAEDEGVSETYPLQLFRWPQEQFATQLGEYELFWDELSDPHLLHIAAWYGVASLVEAILNHPHSPNINVEDERGNTPLHCAAVGGQHHIVDILLKRGNIKGSETALTPCSFRGKRLIVDYRNGEGKTPLLLAAQGGHDLVINKLLETGEAWLDAADECGRTPLMHACDCRHQSTKELLVAKGADVNAVSEKSETALLYACWRGINAENLIHCANKETINLKDTDGRTPLLYAAKRGAVKIAELLIR